MLSKEQFEALMVELHSSIEEAATSAVDAIGSGNLDPTYPPNAGFTNDERQAIASFDPTPALASALRKVVADGAATPLFRLFSLLDGLADPGGVEEWPVWELVESEDGEVFYENWLEAYWVWRARRPDPGWRLDTYEGG